MTPQLPTHPRLHLSLLPGPHARRGRRLKLVLTMFLVLVAYLVLSSWLQSILAPLALIIPATYYAWNHRRLRHRGGWRRWERISLRVAALALWWSVAERFLVLEALLAGTILLALTLFLLPQSPHRSSEPLLPLKLNQEGGQRP